MLVLAERAAPARWSCRASTLRAARRRDRHGEVRPDADRSREDARTASPARWSYNTDLFDARHGRAAAGPLRDAARGARPSPPDAGSRSCRCSPRPSAQQLARRVERHGAAVPPARRCLHELFEAQARAHARRPSALVFGGEDADLRRARRAGPTGWPAACARLGVGPEVRVALCLERSLELVVGLLGGAQGRRRLRAARPGLPARSGSRFMLEDAGAPVLLTQALPCRDGRRRRRVLLPGRAAAGDGALRARRAVRPGEPGLRDLHLGLDRPPKGVAGAAPRAGEPAPARRAQLYEREPGAPDPADDLGGLRRLGAGDLPGPGAGASLCLVRDEDRLTPSVLTGELVAAGSDARRW